MNGKENEHSQLKEELEELEKAMPIKDGGLRFLFAVTITLGVLTALVLSSCHLIFMEHNPITPIEMLSFFCAMFCVIGLGVLPLLILCIYHGFYRITQLNARRISQIWPFYWLRAYWQRNVRGNSAWLCLYEHGELKIKIEGAKNFLPENFLNTLPKNMRDGLKLALLVPMGGWSNRPKDLSLCNQHAPFKIQECQVKINVISPWSESLFLFFQDNAGSKTHIGANNLLNILLTNVRTPFLLNGIMGLIHGLYTSNSVNQEKLEKSSEALAAAQDKIATCENDLAKTVDSIFKRIQEIKDTSRFGKSEEGRRLRESMEKDLLELLPPDHAYQKVLKKT
ncbi:hypothetical protein KKD84_04205 [Patescibacteria group bacterium]|nr:hypothetical protein [Patescibacteria group bacterium]